MAHYIRILPEDRADPADAGGFPAAQSYNGKA
jgi:hypothetical protein